jgi:hypothetical protein
MLNAALGGILARESFTLSQTYYFGSASLDYAAVNIEGDPIDTKDGQWDAIFPAKASIADAGDVKSRNTRIYECIQDIYSNTSYYEPSLRLTAMFFNSGMSKVDAIATVKSIMKAHPSPNGDLNEYIDHVDGFLASKDFSKEIAQNKEVFLENAKDLVANLKPVEYVLEEILVKGYVYALTAKNNHGKTTLATKMMAAVTTGGLFAGKRTQKGRVLLLSGENTFDTMLKFKAMPDEMDLSMIDVISTSFDMKETEEKIITKCDEHSYSLVVADSNQAYFGNGDMNSNGDMLSHIKAFRGLTKLFGDPAVVILSHPIKNADKSSLIPYGGGSAVNELDGNLTLWLDGGVATLSHLKLRQPSFDELRFKLNITGIDGLNNNFGGSVTSTYFDYINEAQAEDLEEQVLEEYVQSLRLFLTRNPTNEEIGRSFSTSDNDNTLKTNGRRRRERFIRMGYLTEENELTKKARNLISKRPF